MTLANFISKHTPPPFKNTYVHPTWTLLVDGLATLGGGGARLVVKRLNKLVYEQAI